MSTAHFFGLAGNGRALPALPGNEGSAGEATGSLFYDADANRRPGRWGAIASQSR